MARIKSLLLFPFRLLHYIYLQIQAPFRSGNAYLLEIPSEFRESDKTFFMEMVSGRTEKPTYLQFLSTLRQISENPDIKKLFYIAEETDFGLAEMYEIGKVFERLKNKGVKLCGYSSKGDYKAIYLLSFADERYVHPKAEFTWLLPAAESFFFQGALKKAGIEVESFASGKYKSFAETFTRTGFSKEAKQNLESLLKSLNEQILETMSVNTGDDDWKDRSPLINAGLLKEMKFAEHITEDDFRDNCVYEDLKPPENEEEDKEEKYEILSYGSLKYRHKLNRFRFIRYPKEKIAVIPLKGDINDSERDETERKEGNISSGPVLSLLREVQEMDDIQYIVLEIDSGGGSAFASSMIYDQVLKLKKTKKIYVYQANYSASGGYFIASASDQIFSNPMCITGSIGAVMVRPNLKGLYEKLGITKDRAGSRKAGDIFSEYGKLSEESRKILSSEIHRIRDEFYDIVCKSRKISLKELIPLAEGRVFTGLQFLHHKMVDYTSGLLSLLNHIEEENSVKNPVWLYFLPEYSLKSAAGELDGLKRRFIHRKLKKRRHTDMFSLKDHYYRILGGKL